MKIIAITSMKNVNGGIDDFYKQISKVSESGVDKIILREKELDEKSFTEIALKCKEICEKSHTDFAINKYFNVAKELSIKNIHLSIFDFIENRNKLDFFDCIGVSVHSLQEAETAQNLGASYIIAGHIFKTACKEGLEPRGINFLREICDNIKIPVYAIGGISPENISEIKNTNAHGICLMSSMMKAPNPKKLVNKLGFVGANLFK